MKEPKGTHPMGRMWSLYKTGGVTPAIASLLGSSHAQQMAFIRSMSRANRKMAMLGVPLAELEAVVFDLETTGFHPYHGDEIISIGAVEIRGGEIGAAEPFYRLVKPKKSIPKHVVELTGITDEQAQSAPELMEALHDFLNFVGHRLLIAHASGHDKAFLNAALWRTSKANLNHRVLDTMMIAKWLEPNRPDYGLDGLLEDYRIPVRQRHHAREDSIMTADLYFAFLKQIESRQVVTLDDLYAHLSRH